MKTEIEEILGEIDELGQQLATALFNLSSLKERLKNLTDDQSDQSDLSDESDQPDPSDPSDSAPVRDLRSVFSINDRFRFRRELFGGSDAEMQEVLEQLGAMDTPEQAEAYILAYPGLESDNPEVKAFMAIVRRALSDRPSHVI